MTIEKNGLTAGGQRPIANMEYEAWNELRDIANGILLNPFPQEWTVSGLGMLRCYPDVGPIAGDTKVRLNVWNFEMFREEAVSDIHDHPWSFTSIILNGKTVDVAYKETIGGGYRRQSVDTKGDSGLIGKPIKVGLKYLGRRHIGTGQVYFLDAGSVHATYPEDGAVTINFRQGNTGRARVYWGRHSIWGDAKPRTATREEIIEGTRFALSNWTDVDMVEVPPGMEPIDG